MLTLQRLMPQEQQVFLSNFWHLRSVYVQCIYTESGQHSSHENDMAHYMYVSGGHKERYSRYTRSRNSQCY